MSRHKIAYICHLAPYLVLAQAHFGLLLHTHAQLTNAQNTGRALRCGRTILPKRRMECRGSSLSVSLGSTDVPSHSNPIEFLFRTILITHINLGVTCLKSIYRSNAMPFSSSLSAARALPSIVRGSSSLIHSFSFIKKETQKTKQFLDRTSNASTRNASNPNDKTNFLLNLKPLVSRAEIPTITFRARIYRIWVADSLAAAHSWRIKYAVRSS